MQLEVRISEQQPFSRRSLGTYQLDKHQQRVLIAFRRVVNFVDARPELTLESTSEGRGLKARVDALGGVIERLSNQAVAQHVFAAQVTQSPTEAFELKRSLVDDHLRSIGKVARGLRGTVPGIGVLKMPSRTDRNAKLVEVATAFAQQATIYKEVLTEHGLPSDVIEQLNAAIDAFRASIDSRGTARSELQGATKAVRVEIALGKAIVEGLDGVIPRAYKSRPQDIAAWRGAKRVGRSSASAQSSPAESASSSVAAGSGPRVVETSQAAVESTHSVVGGTLTAA